MYIYIHASYMIPQQNHLLFFFPRRNSKVRKNIRKKKKPYPSPRKVSPLNNSLPILFSFTLHKHHPPPAQRRQQ